jgi:hypothetical protein
VRYTLVAEKGRRMQRCICWTSWRITEFRFRLGTAAANIRQWHFFGAVKMALDVFSAKKEGIPQRIKTAHLPLGRLTYL